MRAFNAWLILFALALEMPTSPGSAWAQTAQPREVFAPPGEMWLLPGSGVDNHGKPYGPSSPDANWNVNQWNTPEDLPPFHDRDTSNGSLGVHLEPDHNYILEQNGKALTCDRTYASGRKDVHEFDLFVSPNNANRPEYPQAVHELPILGSIHHLIHRITVEPLLVEVLDPSCPVTRVTFVTALTLNNPTEKQAIFYQLRLGIVQARGGAIQVARALPPAAWFAKGVDVRTGNKGYYLFADSITYFGKSPAKLHEANSYTIDLLPRIVELIKAGAADGLDQDLSHWLVRGTYHGEIIWGHIHVRSHWKNFSLAVD